MANALKNLVMIGMFLVGGLMAAAWLPPVAITAEAGQPTVAPGKPPINPEEFIRQFDALVQSQKLPPEAAGLFQGMRGIMDGAAKGQDPQTLREKSSGLLQGMKPLMENPNLPPEAAKMFRSFEKMGQPGAAPLKPEEFMQQFQKLMQNNKIPPEAAGFFQGMRGIMEGAAKGRDSQVLKEQSRGLLQGAKPLMENPDLPPEAAEMFKSFRGMMQTPSPDGP
jgi:hypothetical protein